MTSEEKDQLEALIERVRREKDRIAISLRDTDNFTPKKWNYYKELEHYIKVLTDQLNNPNE
jgi:hypothetical protein